MHDVDDVLAVAVGAVGFEEGGDVGAGCVDVDGGEFAFCVFVLGVDYDEGAVGGGGGGGGYAD